MTVKQIQCLLTYLGYSPGTIDGADGRNTQGATRAFQDDYGLIVDGIPGAATQKMLIGAIAGTAVKVEKPESSDAPKTGTFWDEIEYFTRDEFKCKCGGKYCNGYPAEPDERMVRIADGARRHFGKPAIVISGLRDPIHNRNEGGADFSQHIYGEACDIQIPGVSAETLLNWFNSQPGVRYAYAINATNVHFDVPKGNR